MTTLSSYYAGFSFEIFISALLYLCIYMLIQGSNCDYDYFCPVVHLE